MVEYVLEQVVNASPRRVFDFLCDPRNQRSVHPLIASVRVVRESASGDGTLERDIRIVDNIPVAFGCSMPLQYTAEQRVEPARQTILYRVAAGCAVTLRNTVSVSGPADGPATIRFEAVYAGPPCMPALSARMGRPAHVEALRRTAELLEAPQAAPPPRGDGAVARGAG